jgi:hypothetical protein
MAFSNTVSQTTFNTGRVIDNAFRRCKLTAEQITSEYVDIANDQLYLFLSDLANHGRATLVHREADPPAL